MDKKKIILCYPPLSRYRKERPYHWFPFSVLPLAQKLSEEGYQPIVIDYRVEPNPRQKLNRHLKDALLVGISSMSGYQIGAGLRIAEMVRESNPDIPIIWGGVHPTILPEETAIHPLVDVAVVGMGSQTISDIVNALRVKKNIESIKGIAYKNGKTVTFTGHKEPSELIDDAQQYEKFVPVERYINPNTMWLGYFSGHGCAYRCGFCSRQFMRNKYATNPVEKVIDDIKYFVKNYGFKHIHFQDDNFFLDVKRVFQIAQGLISAKLKLTWWANVRADIIPKLSKDELELLIKSGMNSVFVGAESASQESLDLMKKDIRSDDVLKTNEILASHDILLDVSYIFGLPGDSLDKLRMTTKQIRTLKKVNKKISVQTCFYQPYPGTSLYDIALKWGYPRVEGLEQWGQLQQQIYLSKIPWLSNEEMKLYREEFEDLKGILRFFWKKQYAKS